MSGKCELIVLCGPISLEQYKDEFLQGEIPFIAYKNKELGVTVEDLEKLHEVEERLNSQSQLHFPSMEVIDAPQEEISSRSSAVFSSGWSNGKLEDCLDMLRKEVEKCDSMPNIRMIIDSNAWWAGFAWGLVESIKDCFGKVDICVLISNYPSYLSFGDQVLSISSAFVADTTLILLDSIYSVNYILKRCPSQFNICHLNESGMKPLEYNSLIQKLSKDYELQKYFFLDPFNAKEVIENLFALQTIKRLKKEYDEIEKILNELPFRVYPLEGNFLEWHFTMSGPEDSVYSRGLYHGRIIFPPQYPFSPPSLMFLTPSGRFQVNTKICLSVTGFHPEHWQPAWGVRTMMIAIRNHFLIDDRGAIGSLFLSKSERRKLSEDSRHSNCDSCGYRAMSDIKPVLNETFDEEAENRQLIARSNNDDPSYTALKVFLALVSVVALWLAFKFYKFS